ncbi:MAG: putative glycoside hydrolase [Patescibacteria group bacterium]|nr:putative glycoside hydrolase [bacterium]MDZ4240511.1 putative glycoside hydrolase [Patescibacteria group bacterium]
MARRHFPKGIIIGGFLGIIFFFLFYFGATTLFSLSYTAHVPQGVEAPVTKPKEIIATHIILPRPLKAVYMTACVAGTPSFRKNIVHLIDTTELNAVIIDIKDYSGGISFETNDARFSDAEGENCFAQDMREFIASLHEKEIYVIGRISVFQDPVMTKLRPDLSVQKNDRTVWKDYKGLSFIDVSAREYWDYIVALGILSYKAGFDELNFDYIRFPSDGNMSDIYYPWSEQMIVSDPEFGKAHALEAFFSYLKEKLSGTGAILSADLFGMTATNYDDLNIGQVLEYTLPFFDFVAPMVYPSHYPKTFLGFSNPSEKPYEVVRYSLDSAVKRASTTPEKIRPWLQDFDLGAVYTKEMVRAQIQATYDAGLDSWMLWDAANTYTPGSALPDE